MAAPVTHILLALIALQSLPEKNAKEFIIGTSFPDIRYLKVIDRQDTHNPHATWQSIVQEPSSFKAGMDFHALVDTLRENYLKRQGVYELVKSSPNLHHALKWLEDKTLYEKINQYPLTWQIIGNYFNDILPEERLFNIPEKKLWLWHMIIKNYCKSAPTFFTVSHIFSQIPFLSAKFFEIIKLVNELEKNEQLKKIILQFYDEFESLLKQENMSVPNPRKQFLEKPSLSLQFVKP